MFNKDFFFEKHEFCEIIWKNIVKPGRPQTTIIHMSIACFLPKATNIFSEYVILNACHCNNFCTNAVQCYVIHTLLFTLYYS